MPKTLEQLRYEWRGHVVVDDFYENADISLNADRIADYWLSIIQAEREGLKDNIMGMIVKNSEGFDTYSITGKEVYHLDIKKFEEDLANLLPPNQE